MTIREIEQQVGISKANIRFYEAEGLLNPKRSANNYREYSPEDAERLKKIKCLRTLGISVTDLRGILKGDQAIGPVMEQRIGEIKAQMEELTMVQTICQDLKQRQVRFESLDPSVPLARLEHLRLIGKGAFSQDQKSKLYPWWKAAWMWLMLCIASIAVIPILALFQVEVPDSLRYGYMLVVMLSPLLFYEIDSRMKKDYTDRSRMFLWKRFEPLRREGKTNAGKVVERVHQLCLASIVVLPINGLLNIKWPAWCVVLWLTAVFGSTLALVIVRNREI